MYESLLIIFASAVLIWLAIVIPALMLKAIITFIIKKIDENRNDKSEK